MAGYVLDASAVIALLKREPGAERVLSVLGRASISSAGYGEVVAWMARGPLGEEAIELALGALGLEVAIFDRAAAHEAGLLVRAAGAKGLPLAALACVALARRLGVPVLTADRIWADLDLGIAVELIR